MRERTLRGFVIGGPCGFAGSTFAETETLAWRCFVRPSSEEAFSRGVQRFHALGYRVHAATLTVTERQDCDAPVVERMEGGR